jgi:phosphatidylinositol glycan class B
MQAILATIGDLYLYKFSRRLADQSTAQWTLCCQLASWFTFYCGTRTLTNSVETVITTVAMYYFPWPETKR